MAGLADKNHNLTILSSNLDENPLPNMHYIYLEKSYEVIYNGTVQGDLSSWLDYSFLQTLKGGRDFIYKNWRGSLKL